MKNTLEKKTSVTKATTSKPAKKTAVKVESYVVPEKWERIHVTIERADCDYLVEQDQAYRKSVGLDVLMYVCNHREGGDIKRCNGHAVVAEPVGIVIEMENRRWADVVAECEAKDVDLASAIRWAIAARCAQLRKYRKSEARKKSA